MNDISLVRNVSNACISQDEGRMDGLDRVLIYDLCTKAIPWTLSPPTLTDDPRLWQNMEIWFSTIGGQTANDALDIVKTIKDVSTSPFCMILSEANVRNQGVSGVFCRALLLLRLAMTLLEWQWRQIRTLAVGGRSTWQQTLLRQFAENCNIVSSGSTVPGWVDFSQDHQKAVDEISDDWLLAGFSSYDLWDTFGAPLRELCRFERVALWTAVP